MADNRELAPERLYTACDWSGRPFHTTADLEDMTDSLGQVRALDAMKLGIGMRHEGFNLYVMGSPGLGKHLTVKHVLETHAARLPIPSDWCYVNNFKAPHKPRVLRLPAGTGAQLQKDMRVLVRNLAQALPADFESDVYRTHLREINEEFKGREEQTFVGIAEEARRNELLLVRTPMGYTIAPTRNGAVMEASEFEKLTDAEKQEIQKKSDDIRSALRDLVLKASAWQREQASRIERLNEEVTRQTVDRHIGELELRFRDQAEITSFLREVRADIIENVSDFRDQSEDKKQLLDQRNRLTPFNRYYVNVLVDTNGSHGAPVVYEDNPTYQNLIGRIEHLAQFGTLLTDFTMIKCGALHRANGGYLILDARKVLSSPFAWDALKRVLQAREVRIQSLEQMLSLVSTISLEPEAVPLSVKVVLVGERLLYYLLNQLDPDFNLLFKVEADFSEDIDRTPENMHLYARLIATLQRREHLHPMDSGAVGRIIEHAARRVEDSEKLSLHMEGLLDLMRESDYHAREAGGDVIRADDVEQAIAARIRRSDQVRERWRDSILRNIRMIDTTGSRVAQVNGLAVIQLGEYAFGHPSRISATARLGAGKVVDIEREVELGGAIHTKGVLILSSYLGNRYARDEPLSLSASLVFEQSYGPVEGDSASVAELCTLLSALSDVPLRQDLAITGSVNQHGEVQAVGGVNEKIEGFFDICNARGLTGTQGAIIPAMNARHLMLRRDVVEAVSSGRFHVYAANYVDDAIEILTGQTAGAEDADGEFPIDSVNGRVRRRLRELSELRRRFSGELRESAENGRKS